MRIHSYGRIEQIVQAMSSLGYHGRDRGWDVDTHIHRGIGNRLIDIEARRADLPLYVTALTRLLREDGILANAGRSHTTLVWDGPATLPRHSDYETWLSHLKVIKKEQALSFRSWQKYLIEGRSVVFDPDRFEGLTEAFENVNFTNFRRSGRYGTFDYALNPEVIGEEHARYRDRISGLQGSSMEFGPVYRVADYNYAQQAIGVGANGQLYSFDQTGATDMAFVDLSQIARIDNVETLIEQARSEYRQTVLDRMRQWRNVTITPDETQAREERMNASRARFEQFRAKQEATRVGEMLIPTLPFVEPGKGIKASRRWGIEIETGAGRDLSGVPDQWDSKDDGSLESAYGSTYIEPEDCEYAYQHELEVTVVWADARGDEHEAETRNPEYVDPYDCYSCGDTDDGDYDSDDCVELVSPILNSMHSRGLKQICDDLEHAPRTESAGVHVHVEAKDLNVKQIKELVMGYDHIERFIESSYDRVERGYCKRRSARELLDVVRQRDEGLSPRDMRTGDRYVTVNLQAIAAHGTIEFRAMGPRYNYDHLIRWAMFCREMVNVFANGATSKHFAKAKSWNDVLAIFAKYGSEYNFATVGALESETEFEDIEVTV